MSTCDHICRECGQVMNCQHCKPYQLPTDRARIAELEADLKRVINKYDEENPIRFDVYHLTGCDCMQCRVDDARATLTNTK